ncbi:hypothetical protein VTK56DRAFT_7723 [Thermocarpiscus australiensis]
MQFIYLGKGQALHVLALNYQPVKRSINRSDTWTVIYRIIISKHHSTWMVWHLVGRPGKLLHLQRWRSGRFRHVETTRRDRRTTSQEVGKFQPLRLSLTDCIGRSVWLADWRWRFGEYEPNQPKVSETGCNFPASVSLCPFSPVSSQFPLLFLVEGKHPRAA